MICSRLVELALFINVYIFKKKKTNSEIRTSKNWLETKEKDTYDNDTSRHAEFVARIAIT